MVLLVAGTLYCLWYGRIGYMPQDSPAVFDGGWRLLTGQIPFRDFTLPNAITPVVMQSVLFSWFGVTWFVYCLHAALLNGFFCVLVYVLLRTFGGTRLLASWYGLLSGVIFYTPFGVPVQDQHAYFFSTLLIVLTCVAVRSPKPAVKRVIFLALPPVGAIAYLSKQIPTIFIVALALAILTVCERTRAMSLLRPLLAGSGVTIAAILALWITLGIDSGLVEVYFFDLPRDVGAQRVTRLFGPKAMKKLTRIYAQWPPFLSRAVLIPPAVGGMALIVAFLARATAPPRAIALRQRLRAATLPLSLSTALVVICLAFVLLTANAPANGVPLLFACLGLVHVAVTQIFAADPANSSGIRRSYAAIRVAASIALCAISLHSAYRFDRLINRTRMVHDMYYSGSVDVTPRDDVLGRLLFLVWATPPSYSGTLSDFAGVVRYFEAHRGNFLLLGDSSILYALTDRPSVSPVLWLHPGQTLPLPGSKHFPAFQERLLTALRTYDVRYIVIEATTTAKGVPRTWSGVNPSTFPELQRLLTSSGIVREVIGPFTIVEITGAPGEKAQ